MAARGRADARHEEGPDSNSRARRWLDGRIPRIVSVPLVVLLFGAGTWWMWSRYGDQVLAHPSYQLDPTAIRCTERPSWLLMDILPKVIRDGSLESLSIHQPGLTVQVAGAFEHHPWVRRVERVRKKYPAGVDVELSYRFPVGMVVVPQGLHPIDGEGVALPGFDSQQRLYIAPEFARLFPRIFVGQTAPLGQGVGWGDPVVVDAAKLAAFLHPDWETLCGALAEIQPSSRSTSTAASPQFVILGDAHPAYSAGSLPGAETSLLVHWGRAPGKESAGEPPAKTKLAKLKQWLAEVHARGLAPEGEIDLSTIRSLSAFHPGDQTRR